MWEPIVRIADLPRDLDLRLAVIERGEVHALVFPCRRSELGWFDATSGRKVEVYPTHYQPWAGS
jgi:hypothetical protein